jgi:type II secretory pathway component GspD/PulD (secretin)
LALTLFAGSAGARGQTPGPDSGGSIPGARSYETLYLTSAAQINDASDIVTDLRNMLPRAKVYYVRPQNAISIMGTPDDFKLARQILSDMDRPRQTYRLTYTITETSSSQGPETQHVALIAVPGGTTELKQGSRVPIVTGASDGGNSALRNEVQYLDVGLTIKASLEGTAGNLRLRTRIEQSSVAEEKSGMGAQDPVVRQTSLESMSMLGQGKPVVLGSLDLPGSARHMEIEVSSEPVP